MLQLYGGISFISGSKQNTIIILVRNFFMYIDKILKGFVKFEIFVNLSKAILAVKKALACNKANIRHDH